MVSKLLQLFVIGIIRTKLTELTDKKSYHKLLFLISLLLQLVSELFSSRCDFMLNYSFTFKCDKYQFLENGSYVRPYQHLSLNSLLFLSLFASFSLSLT
jgi:hypothetical protein